MRTKHITTTAIFIALFSVIELILLFTFQFSRSEAAVINGKSIDFNSGWISSDPDIKTISFPRAFVPNDSNLIITNTLESEYSGLILSISSNNAVVDVNVDSENIYTEKANTGVEGSLDRRSNLIQLPEYSGSKKISIEISPVNPGSSIYIRNISVSRGDAAIIEQLKGSFAQLFFCVLILLVNITLAILEGIRRYSKWQEENIQATILFGTVAMIYCFISTIIPTLFFGNDKLFTSMKTVSVTIMPLILFHYRESVKPEDKTAAGRIFLISSVIIAVIGLFVCFKAFIPVASVIILSAVCMAAIIIEYIVEDIKKSRKSIPQYILFAGYGFLLVFCVILPLNYIRVFKVNLKIPEALMLTLYIIAVLLSQTLKVIYDYRMTVEKSEQQAIAANKAKGAFLANMSHEIRTPINAVLGMDEMILRESTEPAIRSYASDIYSAGKTLLSLINDILDISKIESGKMEIIPVDYNVCNVINDAVNVIMPRVKKKDLGFECNVSPHIPTRLLGDDVRIRQVMTNMLTNAVKYTERGRIQLNISWTGTDERNGIFHCEVKDTGVGIKPEDMKKLFKKYERIEEDKHKNIEGTGLGISITVKILSLMDSRLRVKSKYGKGSVFYFDLPQEITDPTPVGDFHKHTNLLSNDYEYVGSFTAPKARILIVDDNDMNRKVFKSLLKETKMQIDDVPSGSECLRMIRKSHYDIIFLDHLMPDMDGIETLKKIKESGDHKPVLFTE